MRALHRLFEPSERVFAGCVVASVGAALFMHLRFGHALNWPRLLYRSDVMYAVGLAFFAYVACWMLSRWRLRGALHWSWWQHFLAPAVWMLAFVPIFIGANTLVSSSESMQVQVTRGPDLVYQGKKMACTLQVQAPKGVQSVAVGYVPCEAKGLEHGEPKQVALHYQRGLFRWAWGPQL